MLTWKLTMAGFLYTVWAAVLSNSLFHRVLSLALLSLIISTNALLILPISATTIPLVIFVLLSFAISLLLSPVAEPIKNFLLGPQYSTSERRHRILEVINPTADPSREIVADIVAVHDITSNPGIAWQTKAKSKPLIGETSTDNPIWLRDFIPKEKNLNTRILIFNHYTAWGIDSLEKSLYDHGSDLIFALRNVRQTDEEKQRPIIFVGHGFGGLIIKQAIVNAGEDDKDGFCISIREQARGLIFLGTPHRGARFTFVGKLISLFGYWKGSSTSLLEVAEPGSSINQMLHDSFMSFLRAYKLLDNTLCVFQAKKKSLYGFSLSPVVDKCSAVIDGSRRVGFEARHGEIHTFMSEDDENYQHLMYWIRNWIGQSDLNSFLKKREPGLRGQATVRRETEGSLSLEMQEPSHSLQSMALTKWTNERPV